MSSPLALRGVGCAFLVILASLLPTTARAESALMLGYPSVFGSVPASTYDESGKRLGGAHLVVEKLSDGNVQLHSESGIEGGAKTIATALLEPVDGGRGLRLQLQESRSFDTEGRALGTLRIDHREAVATCTPADKSYVDRVDLPERDLIANVPFNLLFLPLVRGEVESVGFQFVLCNGGARYIDFEAHVAEESESSQASDVVEIRYGPRFNAFVNFVAKRLIPRLTFWFDKKSSDPWLAHRLPLYAKGPEVLVVRDGVSAVQISNGRSPSRPGGVSAVDVAAEPPP